MIHVFKKKVTFEGTEHISINLDLDGLTGNDLIKASRESQILGDVSPVQELSMTYLAVVAAKAAKVSVDMIMALPAGEFSRVKVIVQNFLLG